MTEKINKNLIVPLENAHERLDQALAKLMPEFSRTQIKLWIDAGNVLVNNQVVKAKRKLEGGEQISIQAEMKAPTPQHAAQPISLNTVYEDESLLIINKPAGLVVHPGAGNADQTLLNAILYHAKETAALPRAGILHRLDKDTSGLLLVAKTSLALRHLSQQLKKRTIEREYQTITYGHFISGGTINAAIERHPVQRKRMAISETGKSAVTHYRVMEKYRGLTRLKVRLETGRTHQIRVHMSYIRHPIVGDVMYGGRVQLSKGMTPELIEALRGFKRQALHAFALGFKHPVTDEYMRFEIDLPEDMKKLISVLQADMKRISE